jgi:predicted nucleic acid-binding protein
MRRFVIGPDVALELAERRASIPVDHRLLAPTLLRSQVLAQLYGAAQLGRLSWKEADKHLEYLRKLNIRLLRDRALQHEAWKFAERFGWGDTFVAEYVALTKLHADALVVSDLELRGELGKAVPVATIADLLGA